MDIGRVHQRTAQRRASGLATRGKRSVSLSTDRYDRYGRLLGQRNPEGKVYEPCPMCLRRACTRTRMADGIVWKCEYCTYIDHSERGSLV